MTILLYAFIILAVLTMLRRFGEDLMGRKTQKYLRARRDASYPTAHYAVADTAREWARLWPKQRIVDKGEPQ